MANNRVHRRLTRVELFNAFTYDSSIGKLRWKVCPRVGIKIGDIAGCNKKNGYRSITYKGKSILEHIAVFVYFNGEYDYEMLEVDHKNLNTVDNRIENLRLITPKQNSRDKGIHKAGGNAGVNFVSARNKFSVHLYEQGKLRSESIYFGLYDTKEEATSVHSMVESGFLTQIIASRLINAAK